MAGSDCLRRRGLGLSLCLKGAGASPHLHPWGTGQGLGLLVPAGSKSSASGASAGLAWAAAGGPGALRGCPRSTWAGAEPMPVRAAVPVRCCCWRQRWHSPGRGARSQNRWRLQLEASATSPGSATRQNTATATFSAKSTDSTLKELYFWKITCSA